MVINGGGGTAFAVASTGSVNITVLGTTSFHSCSASVFFVVEVVVVAYAAKVAVSKLVALLEGYTVVACSLLVASTTSFCRKSFLRRFG